MVDAAASPVSRQRTDEIRRVAARLFAVSGYSATTMTDIANAVGILPGSLYHHFAAKEEIAVEILTELDQELSALAAKTSRRLTSIDGGPEERLRYVAREVTELSIRSRAALRLYSYEAPSVATERFRTALKLQAPALEKVWKRATEGLVPASEARARDLGLLRFALHHLTLNAALNVPSQADAVHIARQTCDLLLEGLVTDCPDDRTLDDSAAMHAARAAMAEWPALHEPTGSGTREDIIAAARAEFARRGYSATTIRDVAEAAEVRMGTLYRRVDSKEELLKEVLGGYTSSMDLALRSVLTTGTSVAASVDAFALVFVHGKRRFRQESDIVKFSSRGLRAPSAPFQEYFEQTQNRFRLLERLLTQGIADRSVRPISDPGQLGPHVRAVVWLPYQDFGRTSAPRTHAFLRGSLLRGFLTPRR
ncbi:TetR family transcriptional regulator [Actinocorallia herbida]|uniref:TetR family transcriptional regulator n=1 Tax=Actinocorallia herbida TaxID=58109 RepID=A0A3N1CY35_9ACTN|nr:TetR family transcriptional regulator [Actinocorallia herbida]